MTILFHLYFDRIKRGIAVEMTRTMTGGGPKVTGNAPRIRIGTGTRARSTMMAEKGTEAEIETKIETVVEGKRKGPELVRKRVETAMIRSL